MHVRERRRFGLPPKCFIYLAATVLGISPHRSEDGARDVEIPAV